jgi:hypothetical protein
MIPSAAQPQPLQPTLPTGSEPAGLPAGSAAGSTTLNEEPTPEATVTPDNTTGRQEPAISLEWV